MVKNESILMISFNDITIRTLANGFSFDAVAIVVLY
jgi:hypothetical protein